MIKIFSVQKFQTLYFKYTVVSVKEVYLIFTLNIHHVPIKNNIFKKDYALHILLRVFVQKGNKNKNTLETSYLVPSAFQVTR